MLQGLCSSLLTYFEFFAPLVFNSRTCRCMTHGIWSGSVAYKAYKAVHRRDLRI